MVCRVLDGLVGFGQFGEFLMVFDVLESFGWHNVPFGRQSLTVANTSYADFRNKELFDCDPSTLHQIGDQEIGRAATKVMAPA